MEEPLVSVTMITYNHAPFIAQAIEGVINQKTNFPFELVIGEDCSTDGTREIVFDYQKQYPDIIRVITSDKNVGMTKNGGRNRKACRGKYIAFCEGDDYWHHPYKLQMQTDYLESHPECGLTYSSYDVYHIRTMKKIHDFIKYKNWQMPENPSMSDFIKGTCEIGCGILTCTIMVRRTLLEQIIESDPFLHGNEQFLMGDTQLWAEISTKARLHYIPESLATHVITAESATRSADITKELRFQISAAEMMLYLCHKYKLPSSTISYHEANWCGASLRLAYHTRSAELAEAVRSKKMALTWKESFKYYGAKYRSIYYVHQVASLLLNSFRKEHDNWQ